MNPFPSASSLFDRSLFPSLAFVFAAFAAVACSSGGSIADETGSGRSYTADAATGDPAASASSTDAPKGTATSPAGDAGTTGPNTGLPTGACGAVTADLCKRAAACAGDGRAVFAYLSQGSVAGTEDHKSEADCRNYYAYLVCSKPGALDVVGCSAVAIKVSCVGTSAGAAFPLPEACRGH